MDPWHLTQVLIQNSPFTRDVEIALDNTNVLPAFFRDLLDQYDEGMSEREVLEMEMVQRKEEHAALLHRLVLTMAEDSTELSERADLEAIFLADSMGAGPRSLYTMHLADGNYTTAHTMATELGTDPRHATLVDLGELLADVNGEWRATDIAQRNELLDLAFTDDTQGGARAWAASLFLNRTDSIPQGWLPMDFRAMLLLREERERAEGASALGAYPNPASDRVVFTYPEGLEQGSIEVFDILGQPVRTIALNGTPAFTELALNGWPEGIYLARLVLDGFTMGETKFTRTK